MTRSVCRALLSAAIPLCGACITTSLPKTPMQGGPAWQEIATEHFIIDTDLEATEVSAVASQLERTRRVLTEVVFRGPPKATLPLRVLALRYDEYSHFDRKAQGRYISAVLFPTPRTWKRAG
jgi:hypothetical protein